MPRQNGNSAIGGFREREIGKGLSGCRGGRDRAWRAYFLAPFFLAALFLATFCFSAGKKDRNDTYVKRKDRRAGPQSAGKKDRKKTTSTWRESRTRSPKGSVGLQHPDARKGVYGLQHPKPQKECWVATP